MMLLFHSHHNFLRKLTIKSSDLRSLNFMVMFLSKSSSMSQGSMNRIDPPSLLDRSMHCDHPFYYW